MRDEQQRCESRKKVEYSLVENIKKVMLKDHSDSFQENTKHALYMQRVSREYHFALVPLPLHAHDFGQRRRCRDDKISSSEHAPSRQTDSPAQFKVLSVTSAF